MQKANSLYRPFAKWNISLPLNNTWNYVWHSRGQIRFVAIICLIIELICGNYMPNHWTKFTFEVTSSLVKKQVSTKYLGK